MMQNRDEAERLRDAFAATSPDDVATSDCPPAERIWEAVKDELGPKELREVLHHIASCPVCTESWRLASEIEGGGAVESARAPRDVVRPRSFGWMSAASAAAAVVAVFLVGYAVTDRFSTGSTARAGASEELSLITGDTPLSRSECRPRWVAVEGATYDVQLLTESLEVVFQETGLSAAELLVPSTVLESLPAESQLLLRIEARRPRELPQAKTVRLPC